MPIPPNLTAATAVTVDAGDTFILDVSEAPDPYHSVWYTHTVSTAGTYLSLWAKSEEGADYRPRIWVYTGDPDNLTTFLIGGENDQILVPLDTVGVSYFFEIYETTAQPIITDLNFSAVAAPSLNAPAGSVAVNEDTSGYPLVIFDSSGTVLNQIAPFPSGEFGVSLTDGTLLIEDFDNGRLLLYNAAFDIVSIVPYPAGYTGRVGAIGSNVSDTFIFGMSSTGQIASVSSTGVVTMVAWDVNNIHNISLSPDTSIVYYTGDGSSLSAPIKTISFPGGVAGANLAAGVTNYFPMEVLVRFNGDILVAYFKSTGIDDNFVRLYSPAGATLMQYEFGADQQINHLAEGFDDTFWVWAYVADGYSRFLNIDVATGAILESFDKPTYVGGVCDVTGALLTTNTRFGTPFSCPFWITTAPYPVNIQPDVYGTSTELPIRWVLRSPVIS